MNKEEQRAYDKSYYQKNRDKILARKKEYYQENIEERKLYNIKYNKIHSDLRKKYHDEHKEEKKINFKKWYKNNPNYKSEWYKLNPNKRRLYDLKKKELRKNWGIELINEHFKDSHFHHMHIDGNHSVGIYIPAKLHNSISHKYNDEESMDKINRIAIEWYPGE